MKEKFFNIRYVFGKENVWQAIDNVIDRQGKGYVVVADGVVVNTAQRFADYRKCLSESLFAMCDSGWVPLYIKKVYGDGFMVNGKMLDTSDHYTQYCGPQIFKDFVERRKHRMFFMGTSQGTLDGLKRELTKLNPDCADMTFYSLPFRSVEEFDYEGIAKMVEDDGADVIWVALGAPKQCYFMQRLLPHLKKGVMLGVGAAFKFYSGTDEKRAPLWMRKAHLEFVYRIMQDPKKQLTRCWWIVRTLPSMYSEEKGKKRMADAVIKAMREYVKAVNKGSKKIADKTRKVTEVVYEYDESRCRDKMNLYWLKVVDSVLDALDVTVRLNGQDAHLKSVLKQYASDMVALVDKDVKECQDVLDKAKRIGVL